MSVRVLWNPASGRGRGARAIGRIGAAFAAHGVTDLRATTAAGDEARLVHEAIADGVQTIVVAGGDGTWGKCAVALAKAGSPARMAFVAAGTGNDFAKNLRAPARDPEAMARLVASGGVERRVDLGRVDDAWFANVAGFGFDVAVLRASARVPLLRGPAVYVVAALGELFAYPGMEARIAGIPAMDQTRSARRLMFVIANGKEFGGTFRIAPGATVDDGRLDAVLCEGATRRSRVPLLLRAIRGTHIGHPNVRHHAGASFTLTCDGPVWCELDGELHRTATGTVGIHCLPGVLRVLDAPPG
jgi:diacylglycerol kinase (ATP)